MKEGKGGNRERIISWYFNEERHKNEQAKEENIETSEKVTTPLKDKTIYETVKEVPLETSEEKQPDVKPVITVEQVQEQVESLEKSEDQKEEDKPRVTMTPLNNGVETFEKNKEQKQEGKPTVTITPLNNGIETSEKANTKEQEISKPNAKEQIVQGKPNVTDVKEPTPLPPDVQVIEKPEPKTGETISNTPTLSEDKTKETEENTKTDNLIQASIIQELNRLLEEDVKDLNDIHYKLKVIENYDKDAVLVDEVERLQKELQELIKRFEEIKKKYDINYYDISLKDLDLIDDLEVGNMIENYISEGKNGNFDESIFGPITQIKAYINIINGIIGIDKDKDIVEENLEEKLDTYKIRDDEFEKLQDNFANVEKINDETTKYQYKVNAIIDEINSKLANNVDIEKSIKSTTSVVPNINRILGATALMASSTLIPPTPTGRLFKASLFVTAAHMLATSFQRETQEKEITHITVTDYSKSIEKNRDDIKLALNDIAGALDEITYMKDTFEKEFAPFRNQIPEYDKFIENIFSIEKELSKNQVVIRDYSDEVERSLEINNQKIKTYEE